MHSSLLSLGLFLMRVAAAAGMFFGHGLGKIDKFDTLSKKFHDPFGMGDKTSLIFAIIGEVVCPVLVALGLLTRFAALGTAFTMGVAAFSYHMNDPLFMYQNPGGGNKEPALLYLTLFATLVFTGPGKISLDALIFRGRRTTISTTTVTPPPRNETRPI